MEVCLELSRHGSIDSLSAFGIGLSGKRQHRPHRERVGGHPVNEESCVGCVLRKAGEVFGGELAGVFAHLWGEAVGVVGADLEGDDRVDIAEDGVRGLVVELGQILVGDDEGEAVFAGLAEDAGEAAGGEVLELVDVEAEVAAGGQRVASSSWERRKDERVLL